MEPPHKNSEQNKNEDSLEACMSTKELLILKSNGYKFMKKISQGVSANIFLCSRSSPNGENKIMACKVIDKINGKPKFINKFLPREIDILKKISNEHCIEVYGFFELPSKSFVFMRLAEKGDLLDYLSENGSTKDDNHTRMWMRQLLLGVKYLHSQFIAHRDIKCENILITDKMNAKLGDFGFSRYWINNNKNEIISATYCGSISYAAPEILMGSPYCPKYCDIWSLGVVFFIMLNLVKPFTNGMSDSILKQQLKRSFKFRSQIDRMLSTELKDIIKSMLEPDVKKRATAESVLQSEWMVREKLLLQLIPDTSN